MQEYITGLKALEGFNLRINTTECVQAIATFLTTKKLASAKKYNLQSM